MSSNRRLTAAPSSAPASPIWVRDTSNRRSVASIPQADSTAATRGTMTRAEPELARDVGGVQPGRAAEREQREAPRIDAAPHRDEPHALGHVRVDDAMDAGARPRSDRCQAAPAIAIDGALGRRDVEPAVAAEEIVRVEIAEHEVGVGHGRLGAALAVAGRPRHRAGALRPDMQDAAGIDPRDRAAAGADAGDVEAVQGDAVAADLAVHDQRRRAVDHQADIGRGAAHVERDQVFGRRSGARRRRCRRRRRPVPTAPPPAASRPASAIGATPPCDWMISVGPRIAGLARAGFRAAPDSATAPGRHRR